MKILKGKNAQQIVENDLIGFHSLWKREENNPFISFFLLEECGDIIGLLFFSTLYDRIEIEQFEVLESKRQKGFGTILLQELLDYAKEIDIENITLEVREDNNNAISLYHKMGFQKVATRRHYYQEKDGILMEKR